MMMATAVTISHVAGLLIMYSMHYVAKQRKRLLRKKKQKQDDGDDEDVIQFPIQTVRKFELEAKTKLPALSKLYYGYPYNTGQTERSCRQAFQSLRIVPRVLRGDVRDVDTTVQVFDQTCSLPVFIAPTAFHTMATPDGEIATARGAGRAGAGYCYNWMYSNRRYDRVCDEPGVKWLQMYMFQERELVAKSIELAESTGSFSAVIVTIDHPHLRVQETLSPYFAEDRYPDWFDLDRSHFPNQDAVTGEVVTTRKFMTMDYATTRPPGGTNDSTLSWDDLKWIKSLTKLPVVAKGILSPHDAKIAVEAGVDGIVVSNHGGRQTDIAPPAIEALPAIVAAVRSSCSRRGGGEIPVFVDSGVRTSGDIIRAICLGAKGVLLGRPPLWALACGGADALQEMLDALKNDLECDMRSLGLTSLDQLDLACLWPSDRERIERTVQSCGEDVKLLLSGPGR